MTPNFFRRRQPRKSRARRPLAPHFRPLVEQLEDRSLLATIAVTGTGDTIAVDGLVTLREAITSANNNADLNADVAAVGLYGMDTISVPSGTYTLTIEGIEDEAAAGDLDIRESLTITGAGAATTIIQAGTTRDNGIDRVFDVLAPTPDPTDLTLSGVTIRHGRTAVDFVAFAKENGGGGINYLGFGTLTVQSAVLTDNTAQRDGGAIRNGAGLSPLPGGIVNVDNSTIANNAAGDDGGGINTDRGTVNVSNSVIRDNTAVDDGGGLVSEGGTLTISSSTISANIAGEGGGIKNDGAMTITNSTISGNRATGGDGGGVFNQGNLSITGVVISGNNASVDGGGIGSGGNVTMTNSTISGNRADGSGGGINNSGAGTVSLLNVTITNNTADQESIERGDGGGVFNATTGAFQAANTIIAGNIDNGGEAPDMAGTLNSQGFNLLGNTAGTTIIGVTAGNILGQNPLLGPLANNGGFTFTHALLAGSPALNAANPAVFPPSDQRGIARPQGTGPDIGAGEFIVQPTNQPPILAAIGNKSVDEESALSFTATATDPDLPAQSLTFTLDVGAPAGASITAGGEFSWTPTEDQGPGSYSITVRVTDNGLPPLLDDFETITITVNEVSLLAGQGAANPSTLLAGETTLFSSR